MSFRTSRTFDVVFLVTLAGLLWWAALNRVALGDWIFFLRFEPSTVAVQTADQAGLNATGRRLFYRSDPQFVDLAQVTAECDTERLGCLTSKGQAYVLQDAAHPAQTVVTAAHEMLHLAYRRLKPQQKNDLAPLLDQAMASNPAINQELEGNNSAEDRRDEAHSILGTEFAPLPPALEVYYQAYFSDRTKIVAQAKLEASSN